MASIASIVTDMVQYDDANILEEANENEFENDCSSSNNTRNMDEKSKIEIDKMDEENKVKVWIIIQVVHVQNRWKVNTDYKYLTTMNDGSGGNFGQQVIIGKQKVVKESWVDDD